MNKCVLQALVLFTVGAVLAYGNCNLGMGNLPQTGILLHTLHAHSGPVDEPRNMTLVFDYQVSPVERVEITYIKFNASPTNGCTFTYGVPHNITKGFRVTVHSHTPMTEMSGTADVYGVRYNSW
ncbi:uncharacterized protein LOC134205937 [Armigeres subalbatus]|uniref:uncharacterized protein LOC134205937 n=1 Tax=Armigeres subalbatus TaxID=124917 RepID=UPI002ED2AEEF